MSNINRNDVEIDMWQQDICSVSCWTLYWYCFSHDADM